MTSPTTAAPPPPTIPPSRERRRIVRPTSDEGWRDPDEARAEAAERAEREAREESERRAQGAVDGRAAYARLLATPRPAEPSEAEARARLAVLRAGLSDASLAARVRALLGPVLAVLDAQAAAHAAPSPDAIVGEVGREADEARALASRLGEHCPELASHLDVRRAQVPAVYLARALREHCVARGYPLTLLSEATRAASEPRGLLARVLGVES